MRASIAVVAPTLDILGGQGIQARALLHELSHDGHTVTFVPINPRFPALLRWLRRYPYVRTILNEVLYLWELRHLRRADVVHVFSASYYSFLLGPAPAILVAKLLRKPVVLNYHSGEADDHLTRWRRSVTPLLKLVDEIVVPSSYLQSVFASHGYTATVIPNVIDASQFQYRERSSLRPSLLSVRNLDDYYRVDNTIAAFALVRQRFPQATLSIAGYGRREQRLRLLAERVGGIRFLGRIEPSELPAIYDAADIFLNSSVVDNQPVSILEAFASGLPVISTPTGDIRAMLCDGAAGLLVNPNDPVAMAEAITRLVTQPELSFRIAGRAREEMKRYSWPSVRQQWIELYGKALRPARSREGEDVASSPAISYE